MTNTKVTYQYQADNRQARVDAECADHDEGGKGGWWLSSLELEEFGVQHPGDRLRQRHHRQLTRNRTYDYGSRRIRIETALGPIAIFLRPENLPS